jgi:hypothetical protein
MMPAGRYYVGDLCYVMHDEWDEFCNLTIEYDKERKSGKVLDGEFNLADGRRFATYKTAYGDGTYESNDGTQLSVDAGLIGCILMDDITENISEERILELGDIVEFQHPFQTSSDDGIISFGDYSVDTDPPYDEEPNDEYYDEEEDEY